MQMAWNAAKNQVITAHYHQNVFVYRIHNKDLQLRTNDVNLHSLIFVQIIIIGPNYFRKRPGKDIWQADCCKSRFISC